ncbi:transporter substrate-binding domain-containing protein [Chitinivorax sp. B]|uniref:substrate-binding periplasmic protein n=1 Tax=Chitinivorax sp. B TaxID=2502235 RepID=UPI0014853671|nr:transporter substrate-binding domain-containing protein [Chitinivorax sp. B]
MRACFERWEPYGAVRSDGSAVGIGVDIYRKALKLAGHQVVYTEMSYNRCGEAVKRGSMDLKLFVIPNEIPGLPHLTVNTDYWMVAAVVHQTLPVDHYESLSQFAGMRIGIVRGYVYPEPIHSYNRWDVVDTSNPIQTLMAIQNQRLDLALFDLLYVDREIRERKLKLKTLRPIVVKVPQVAVMALRHQALAKQLDVILTKMRDDGIFDQIYRTHTGKSLSEWLSLAE